jgi:hypothetical protein
VFIDRRPACGGRRLEHGGAKGRYCRLCTHPQKSIGISSPITTHLGQKPQASKWPVAPGLRSDVSLRRADPRSPLRQQSTARTLIGDASVNLE